ncbi:GNAT family N-acetyltransferase [Oceaniglobus ichthyenteri]|uniref:GNAT family N-acetyltransferase n=1 Tax=Oceaniglobus ichthyenteri TaxID=2136177 RepID=UPI000D3B61EF|nr:GNAT family N-acetyltransferase [Oceaniglobus ichthyenteri]
MSVTLRIATQEDHDRALNMATAFHEEVGNSTDAVATALPALLEGLPAAVFYFIGPPRAPVGYTLVSFGYALDLGGPTGTIAELYIRPAVRGRGMGGEAVSALASVLAKHGVRALHMDAAHANPRALVFCRRLGFAARTSHTIMTRLL